MLIRTNTDMKIANPNNVSEIFNSILQSEDVEDQDKEHFWVCGLKSNGFIKMIDLVTLGILNASLVHPREVFRTLISNAVNSVILVHNHPSGELFPSREDHDITDTLVKAGKLLGVPVLDHIIISNNQFYSFKENGLI